MTSSTYRFNGNTIKLKDQDFDRWQKAFKNIPNLEAVLQSRDDWLTYDAEIKTQQRWFLSTSAYLAKLDAKEAKENINKVKNFSKTPLVAIGGINAVNYKNLLLNNANFLAISGYIWKNKKYKPLQAIERLK